MNNQDFEVLDKVLSRLPKSVQPRHDLWPSIAAKIRSRHPSVLLRRNLGLAAAAAACAAIAVTWAVHRSNNAAYREATSSVVTPVIGAAPQNPDPGMQFASSIASDNGLPMAARSALTDNLRLLNDEIQRTQVAVNKYPSDVNLQALLLDLYQQEARLVNDAQQAQIQAITRTSL